KVPPPEAPHVLRRVRRNPVLHRAGRRSLARHRVARPLAAPERVVLLTHRATSRARHRALHGQEGRATSQRATVYGTPTGPPTAKIAVPSAVARAWRINAGSRTKTTLPAGASIAAPPPLRTERPAR